MSLSIKKQIRNSLALLMAIFAISGAITISALRYNKKLSRHLTEVVNPSSDALNDLHKMLIKSEMYSTNWVFIRADEESKSALKKLQLQDFKTLKSSLLLLATKWQNPTMADSLRTLLSNVEQTFVFEQGIMSSLQSFQDYDNPVKRFKDEEILESTIIPRTKAMMNSLNNILFYEENVSETDQKKINFVSFIIQLLITLLAITVVAVGLWLSFRLTKLIVVPIQKISDLVDDLGKGIMRKKIQNNETGNEIGKMTHAVNGLSDKLRASAEFANQIGKRNFKLMFAPLSDEDVLGKALVTMRDNLQSSDERLMEAQHIAKLGSWVRHVDSGKLSWSDEMYNIFDVSSDTFEATYENFLKMIHPDDLEYVKTIGAQYLIDHKPIAYEFRIVTPAGETKVIYAQGKVVLSKDGHVAKTLGIIQDITDRKESEMALKDAHKQLTTLFSNIDDVFFSVDMTTYMLLQMSPACEKIYGYTVEDFHQNPNLWYDIVLDEDKHIINENNPVMHAGKSFSQTYRIRYKDGSVRWVETKISPTLDDQKKLVRIDGVTADVTARKTAEENLKASNVQLQKTNSELDQFVYSVSHDLRAPLTSMLGVVEISKEETQDEIIHNHLDMLKSSIKKLDGFIADILDYSRNTRQEVIREKVDFRDVLSDVTNNLKYMGGTSKPVDIKTNILNGVSCFTDKKRLSVILNNVISNAIRYQNPKEDKPFVDITVDTSDTETNIVVKDNGIGISEENQSKIFDMFYRVSKNSIGSGLGLYIVKETVTKLNGCIGVESEIGKGTQFIISIPNN